MDKIIKEKQYEEDLKFDRTTECDWCGKEKLVAICHYGTSHYNRLVCKECAKKINNHVKQLGFSNYFNPDKLKGD